MPRQPLTLTISPSLSFAAFTLWLLAFPMAGSLQIGNETPVALWLFLVPHIVCLVGLALSPPGNLSQVSAGGTILAIIATATFAVAPGFASMAIVLAGVGAAGMVVGVGTHLSRSRNPARAACLGLILANLLLVGIEALPAPLAVKFVIVIVLLGLPLAESVHSTATGTLKPLTPLLLFVFIYHLIAGFLYSFLLPLYQDAAWVHGSELIIYCLAVVVALWLFQQHRISALFLGVFMAMVACVLLYPMTATGANLGMWAMQAAAGCVDLFLVAYLVTRSNPAQAFAAGCAAICGGILAGALATQHVNASPSVMVFAGSVVLNLAALSLFLLYRYQLLAVEQPPASDASETTLPTRLAGILSEREFMVLQRVINGARYREVADEMNISESSVKTYMNRIFEKTRTRGKKQLLESLQNNELF